MLEVEDAAEAEESQKEEGRSQLPSFEDEGEDVWTRKQRVQRLVEEDMVEAMSDDEEVAGMVLDSIAVVKELIGPEKGEEVLQTRIVSQAEVRRSIEEWWVEAIYWEGAVFSLETKGALRKITSEEPLLPNTPASKSHNFGPPFFGTKKSGDAVRWSKPAASFKCPRAPGWFWKARSWNQKKNRMLPEVCFGVCFGHFLADLFAALSNQQPRDVQCVCAFCI